MATCLLLYPLPYEAHLYCHENLVTDPANRWLGERILQAREPQSRALSTDSTHNPE